MNENNILYKKVQFAYWILVIFLVAGLMIGLVGKNGTYSIAPLIILVIVFFFFHKLTIEIDNDKIAAYFGFNFFRREMTFEEMDPETIESVKINWLTGIGIRITGKGTLYNVKYGKAIHIKSKNKSKTFYVGTDDFEEIRKILIEQIQKNSQDNL